jgi:hypothetical protein
MLTSEENLNPLSFTIFVGSKNDDCEIWDADLMIFSKGVGEDDEWSDPGDHERTIHLSNFVTECSDPISAAKEATQILRGGLESMLRAAAPR